MTANGFPELDGDEGIEARGVDVCDDDPEGATERPSRDAIYPSAPDEPYNLSSLPPPSAVPSIPPVLDADESVVRLTARNAVARLFGCETKYASRELMEHYRRTLGRELRTDEIGALALVLLEIADAIAARAGKALGQSDLDHLHGAPLGEFARDLREVVTELESMLLAKNEAYGDAALSPLRLFSKASPEEQILIRIDDKLSRIARGHADGEDVELDLTGYFILLRIARLRYRRAKRL